MGAAEADSSPLGAVLPNLMQAEQALSVVEDPLPSSRMV